jgi:hypothetical protein
MLALAAAAMAWGCAPSISATRFGDFAARPADHEVRLYSTRLPACGYEEVGLISGKRRTPWTSGEEVLAAMRRRAREVGGDAIVGLGTVAHPGGVAPGESVSSDATGGLSGVVIRFTDPDCRH